MTDHCSDRACERESGHCGLHMSRTWDARAGLEIIDEWGLTSQPDIKAIESAIAIPTDKPWRPEP